MNKFNKLVELAKQTAEIEIIQEVGYSNIACLAKDANELILDLGGDWYNSIMLRAGYSAITANRKVNKMDFNDLANELDDWYKQELYPKLFNTFKSQGKTIREFASNKIIYSPTN